MIDSIVFIARRCFKKVTTTWIMALALSLPSRRPLRGGLTAGLDRGAGKRQDGNVGSGGNVAACYWNIVIAFCTALAAFAAVATALILVWQTRSTLSNQAILQFLAFWQSEPMYPRIRGNASNETIFALGREEAMMVHIDDVLDFFETVSFLTKRKSIGFQITYHTFYWPLANYWVIHKNHILSAQREEGPVWYEYSNLMQQLLAKEKGPSFEEAAAFFADELARCGGIREPREIIYDERRR
jgi:hypothetical protein